MDLLRTQTSPQRQPCETVTARLKELHGQTAGSHTSFWNAVSPAGLRSTLGRTGHMMWPISGV